MNKKSYTITFFLILIAIFVVAYKNSDVKGFRRFLISFKLAVIITFGLLSPADAKDTGFLPGAEGFTPTYICRKRQTYSREATVLSTRLKENPNNQNIPRENRSRYNRRIPEFGSILQAYKIYKFEENSNMQGILEL